MVNTGCLDRGTFNCELSRSNCYLSRRIELYIQLKVESGEQYIQDNDAIVNLLTIHTHVMQCLNSSIN